MADDIGPKGMLCDDPRLTPPEELRTAIAEAEELARVGTRWNVQQTTEVVLRVWGRIIDDIGSYRPYGADDYMHDVSYRMRLDRLLGVLADLGYQDASDWLSGEVDRLDQVFMERSFDDVDDLMLREEKTDPQYWYLRRLPNDDNVVDHLRIIQPKNRS